MSSRMWHNECVRRDVMPNNLRILSVITNCDVQGRMFGHNECVKRDVMRYNLRILSDITNRTSVMTNKLRIQDIRRMLVITYVNITFVMTNILRISCISGIFVMSHVRMFFFFFGKFLMHIFLYFVGYSSWWMTHAQIHTHAHTTAQTHTLQHVCWRVMHMCAHACYVIRHDGYPTISC